MRNFVLILLTVPFFLMSCQSEEGKSVEAIKAEAEADDAVRVPYDENDQIDTNNLAKFKWEFTEHDFGELTEGDVATVIFKFKNVGKVPLTITTAAGSCGCTVADYPEEPVKPGENGEIEVKFNSKGKSGNEQKQVTINANTAPRKTVLTVRSFVKKNEKSEKGEKK